MWENDLYRHSGFRFKTQQDIRLEGNAAMAPAGYGPVGGSIASEDTAEDAGVISSGDPIMHYNGNSGVSFLKNRWAFDIPIGLPRTSTIEGELELGDYGRYLCGLLWGPNFFAIPSGDGSDAQYPGRCGVTFSLIGKRLVQQRGEYHV
jgi:hypothetical protein